MSHDLLLNLKDLACGYASQRWPQALLWLLAEAAC
ncbi:hypothetical protein, partial [Pseudomonas aeruginosa]